jgi:hypothetical protein
MAAMLRSVLFVFIFTASLRADWVIVQKVEGGMNSGEMKLFLKGDRARIDVSNQVSVLTDLASGDSITLNHQSKSLLRIPGTEAAKLRENTLAAKPGETPEPLKLTAADRREKVNGHDCEVFTWSTGTLRVTDWVDRDFPNFRVIMAALARFQNAGLAASAQPLMPPLEQFPGMVIRREMEFRGTKTTTTLISAKQEPQGDHLFAAPEDYREQPVLKLPDPAPGKGSK